VVKKQMRIQSPTPLLMKNIKNFREIGKILCSHLPSMYLVFFSDFQNVDKNVFPFLVFIHLNSLINLWNSGFKKKIILQISGGKTPP
jgi:hypothetical protein